MNDPTTSIRRQANELKVYEKTVRTAIKQDLNLIDYAVWGVLENKINPTSHPNIGPLKTIEREWNKISEEFILKANFFRSVFMQ